MVRGASGPGVHMESVPTDTFQGATASTLASQLGYRVHLAAPAGIQPTSELQRPLHRGVAETRKPDGTWE